MKFLKSLTLGIFAFACTFTFVGCDLFNNTGTLIESPTNEQISAVETAILTNMSEYTGNLTIVNVLTYNQTNTLSYDANSYQKLVTTSTIKTMGTGDNYKASKVQEFVGIMHSVTMDYNVSYTEEKFVSKIGDNFTYIDKTEEKIKNFDTLSAVKTYANFSAIPLLQDISSSFENLSIFTNDQFQLYSLDNTGTSYRITSGTVSYDENNETTALTKSIYEIEIKVGTINNVMLVTYCKVTETDYTRTTVADEWVSANKEQISETNYNYVSSSITIPDTTGYQEEV